MDVSTCFESMSGVSYTHTKTLAPIRTKAVSLLHEAMRAGAITIPEIDLDTL